MVKILVDSKYRRTGDSLNNYEFKLPHVVKNVSSIRLLEATIPRTHYNIPSGTVLLWSYAAADESTSLTAGTYTASELATHLKAVMDADVTGTPITVTYVATTNKFTFATSTSNTFFKNSNSDELKIILGLPLGLDDSTFHTNTLFTSSVPYISSRQVDLSFPRYLILNTSTGSSSMNDVMTAGSDHSFIVNLSDADPYKISQFSALAEYNQIDANANQDVKIIHVNIFTDNSDIPFEPNGINHQLLFELL